MAFIFEQIFPANEDIIMLLTNTAYWNQKETFFSRFVIFLYYCKILIKKILANFPLSQHKELNAHDLCRELPSLTKERDFKKSLERERRAKRKRWKVLLLFLSWTIQGAYAGQPNNVTPIVILIDFYCNSY